MAVQEEGGIAPTFADTLILTMTKLKNRDEYSKDGSSKWLQSIKMRSLTATDEVYLT